MSKPATTVDLASFKKQLADSLERSAGASGKTIVKESLTCEIGNGLQIITAPLQREELPTEKEFAAGVDLLYGYVSIDRQKVLPAGHYVIRLAIPGYETKGEVKVSFIDAEGNIVHALTGQGGPQGTLPGDDTNITPFLGASVCGRKRCFNIKRNGFLDWEWGCTDTDGNTINCIDQQP